MRWEVCFPICCKTSSESDLWDGTTHVLPLLQLKIAHGIVVLRQNQERIALKSCLFVRKLFEAIGELQHCDKLIVEPNVTLITSNEPTIIIELNTNRNIILKRDLHLQLFDLLKLVRDSTVLRLAFDYFNNSLYDVGINISLLYKHVSLIQLSNNHKYQNEDKVDISKLYYSTLKTDVKLSNQKRFIASISQTYECIIHQPKSYKKKRIKRKYQSDLSGYFSLLPKELFLLILSFMNQQDCSRFYISSLYFNSLLMDMLPSVKTELFTHQKEGLILLKKQETEEYQIQSNIINQLSKKCLTHFFCDEPGLGKTLTFVSFIISSFFEYISVEQEVNQLLNEIIDTVIEDDIQTVLFEEWWKEQDQSWKEKDFLKLFSSLKKSLVGDKKNIVKQALRLFSTKFFTIGISLNEIVEKIENVVGVHSWLRREIKKYIEKNKRLKNQRFNENRFIKFSKFTIKRRPLKTTLVVMPQNLLNHWVAQVEEHLDKRYLQDKIIIKYQDLVSNHFSNIELSKVIMIFCTKEELSFCYNSFISDLRFEKSNPEQVYKKHFLTKYKWKRIVLDEGHYLGGSQISDYQLLLKNIQTDNFWIITGTPAKETANIKNDILALKRLLSFSIDSKFSLSIFDETKSNNLSQYLSLVGTLAKSMIRQEKRDVENLPGLKCISTRITPLPNERHAYNSIVSFAKMNTLLTMLQEKKDKNGMPTGFKDSLLNKKNRKYALQVLTNIRVTCCGGGKMAISLLQKNEQEFLKLLRTKHGHDIDSVSYSRAKRFLLRALRGKPTRCIESERGCCIKEVVLPIVTPCLHFMCIDCFEKLCIIPKCYLCSECNQPFSPSQLAFLQPGFDLKWLASDKDFEEDSSKGAYLATMIKREQLKYGYKFKCIIFSQFKNTLRALGSSLMDTFGEDSVSAFMGSSTKRSEELSRFITNVKKYWICSCKFTNCSSNKSCKQRFVSLKVILIQRGDAPQLAQIGMKCPLESMPDFVKHRRENDTLELQIGHLPRNKRIRNLCEEGYQLHLVKLKKHTYCACRRSRNIVQERKVDCSILLLSLDGATGLDLSIANRIVLLDKFWDASLELQAISRAWRITKYDHKYVFAEQLYMSDTIEATMYDVEDFDTSSKVDTLLKCLKLLEDKSFDNLIQNKPLRKRVKFSV